MASKMIVKMVYNMIDKMVYMYKMIDKMVS